jgi:hypothetical protein
LDALTTNKQNKNAHASSRTAASQPIFKWLCKERGLDVAMSTLSAIDPAVGFGAFALHDRTAGELLDYVIGFYVFATPQQCLDGNLPKWRGCRDRALAIPDRYNPFPNFKLLPHLCA